MVKNKNLSSPNVIELENLKILFNEQNYDLLEIEAKSLIQKYSNVPMLYNILGISQSLRKMYKEAIVNFEKAIKLDPKLLDAYNNLGIALKNRGELLKSFNVFHDALKINSDHHLSNFNLGDLYAKFNEIEKATNCFKKAFNSKSDFHSAYSNYLFFLNYSDQYDKNFYYNEALGYSNSIKKLDKNSLIPFQYNKSATKLRVGFVSSDLRNHPVGYFLFETLKYLKDMNLELVAYSNLKQRDEDHLSNEMKFFFSKWHQVIAMSDLELTNLIRKDKINLLIDLSGHSSKSRLPIFINNPAPLQITWIGYLDTTGLKEIDYIIADPFVIDKDQENLFVEKIWRLPNIWNSFSKPNYNIEVDELPAIKNQFITFGSFNHLNKINDSVIKLWSRLLKEIPKSKLFLKYKSLNIDFYRHSIVNKFRENKINQDQLIFEGFSPREDLLKTYNKIDISLDPFPYSGGTTNFESVWMGVPILSLKGKKFISRCGESINHNLGMSDWVAKNKEDFILKAVYFCSNNKKLADLRANLRNKALNSPLFDTKKFAENFHEALWKMWKIFLSKN
jgi:predicted O-linked N-acetylglucosamine transferase (SPINDLY family)